MAKETHKEQISRLETEIEDMQTQLKDIRHLDELEEGGGNARFRTKFNAKSLKEDLKEARIQLTALYMGENT